MNIKKILLLSIVIYHISCYAQSTKGSTKIINQDSSLQKLKSGNIYKLLNSTWTNGGVGVNGEIPDTIMFIKADSLLYIGHEPNTKEICPYYFVKDTLIMTQKDIIYDIDDVNYNKVKTYIIKIYYSNNRLKYISGDYKLTTDKIWTHFDYKNSGPIFRQHRTTGY